MTCESARDLLDTHAGREVPEVFDDHANTCPACAELLAERRALEEGVAAALLGPAVGPASGSVSGPSDAELDEFAALEIESAEEIPGLFVPNFFFGCEADDPMNAVAFQEDLWPFGARLGAFYGSDIGHFDVPDMRNVLPEAYENVEKGLMNTANFRDFVFENPARFYTDSNPAFFDDTTIADAVAKRGTSDGNP